MSARLMLQTPLSKKEIVEGFNIDTNSNRNNKKINRQPSLITKTHENQEINVQDIDNCFKKSAKPGGIITNNTNQSTKQWNDNHITGHETKRSDICFNVFDTNKNSDNLIMNTRNDSQYNTFDIQNQITNTYASSTQSNKDLNINNKETNFIIKKIQNVGNSNQKNKSSRLDSKESKRRFEMKKKSSMPLASTLSSRNNNIKIGSERDSQSNNYLSARLKDSSNTLNMRNVQVVSRNSQQWHKHTMSDTRRKLSNDILKRPKNHFFNRTKPTVK